MLPALIPTIEFRIANFSPSHHIYEFLGWLFAEAANMGVAPGDLRKLVIADDESYGPAISEIDPQAGFTNDGIYRGVGKIIPECVNGVFVGSNLVAHLAMLGCYSASPDLAHPGEVEALRYTFFHEMGHCIDHRRRPAQHTPTAPIMTHSHLKRCASVNSATLLDEYAACFFSAGRLTPAGYGYMADSTRENLRTYLAGCRARRDNYQLGIERLKAVQNAVLDGFWRGLIEYAKLAALRDGNAALGPDLPAWPGTSMDQNGLLEKFAVGLRSAWECYPECGLEFERLTTDTWYALTATEGYVFSVRPEGDHLRLA